MPKPIIISLAVLMALCASVVIAVASARTNGESLADTVAGLCPGVPSGVLDRIRNEVDFAVEQVGRLRSERDKALNERDALRAEVNRLRSEVRAVRGQSGIGWIVAHAHQGTVLRQYNGERVELDDLDLPRYGFHAVHRWHDLSQQWLSCIPAEPTSV